MHQVVTFWGISVCVQWEPGVTPALGNLTLTTHTEFRIRGEQPLAAIPRGVRNLSTGKPVAVYDRTIPRGVLPAPTELA